jgi:hypothetical protein
VRGEAEAAVDESTAMRETSVGEAPAEAYAESSTAPGETAAAVLARCRRDEEQKQSQTRQKLHRRLYLDVTTRGAADP